MENRFEVIFLNAAFEFLKGLERKHYEKILYNMRKAQVENDPELFKKPAGISGSSEHCTREYHTGFLLFG